MADWFKFYENFFDHPRFQYAIHQLAEVCPVSVLLLTEHCRHKSDTIQWSGDEVDILGFSAKINVSPAKINEAILLLQKIRFIEVSDGRLKFLKWNDLQSDYCRKLGRKNKSEVQKSPEKSRKVPLEERRGEENRVEGPTVVPHFPEVEVEPSFQPKSQVVGQDGVLFFKKETSIFFARKESDPWSYAEEQAMCSVLKRPSWRSELAELTTYRKKIPADRLNFDFPSTMRKLLEDWGGAVDKSRRVSAVAPKKKFDGSFVP